MPSVTSWLRLEPRSREDDIQTGLQARIHDPLWLLGRQWQFNEFKAEDSGSPVATRVEADVMQLTRSFMGALPANGVAAGQPYHPDTVPLETMVERELPTADLRFSIDAGRHFLRLLEAQAAGSYGLAYIREYPLRMIEGLDPESARFAASMAGRTIDGMRLYAVLRDALRSGSGPALPAKPPVAAVDQERVLAAARNWLEWVESLVSAPAGESASWLSNRMEYAFAVSAASPQGEIVLEAPDYREGSLDWFSFGVRQPGSLGSGPGEARQVRLSRSTIPAPATYPGMPAERWWELEDSQIDFGRIQTLPGDLTSLVMLQFAVTYGNDWFVIPLDLEVGSLMRIRAVTVTDSFGVVTPVPAFSHTGAADRWRMFTLSNSELFFLPPSLGPSLNGAPVEEVFLARDEMANLAWAIEKRVQDAAGKTIDLTYAIEAPPETVGIPSYRSARIVPDNWIPLVPVQDAKGRLRLRRGALVSPDNAVPPLPKGRLLGVPGPFYIEDEDIPRSGARVARHYQYARWIDGKTHLWLGRRKDTGRGEAQSALRFDTTE
jgi:hypothetical protein